MEMFPHNLPCVKEIDLWHCYGEIYDETIKVEPNKITSKVCDIE